MREIKTKKTENVCGHLTGFLKKLSRHSYIMFSITQVLKLNCILKSFSLCLQQNCCKVVAVIEKLKI